MHVLLVGLALAIGFRAAPRWRPVAQAELIVLEREVLPTETTPLPRVEAQRPVRAPASPVVPPMSPPRVSSSPTPPNVFAAAPTKPETPPQIEETASPPRRNEEERVAAQPPPAPKQDASPTTVARVEDAKPAAGPEGPPRRDEGTEKGGPLEAPRSGVSLFGAPTPSGEERAGSGRAGLASSSGGLPSSGGGGAGRAVAALPGTAASGSGTGVTRSAIPRGGYQVQPAYPAAARQLRIQGTSLLRVYVAADGHVTDVVVTKSAGHTEMDNAAVVAIRQWRFEPGRKGDEPIGMWVILPVEFRLK